MRKIFGDKIKNIIAAVRGRIKRITDRGFYRTQWTIHKYADMDAYLKGKPFRVDHIFQNIFLNEGIGEILDLACGLGSPTAFSNANAYIGVGDSDTAAAATQTGLQASTNKAYAAMDTGYPSRTNQTVTFRAAFGTSAANHAWKEFTVANGNSDSAKNWNRKVSDQGTKVSGQIWTVDLAITIS